MGKFLMRERFGHPQVIAAALLLAFLGQCFWLLVRGTQPLDIDSAQLFRVEEGLRQLRGGAVAGTPSDERLEAATQPPPEIERNNGYDPSHSPLWYLIAAAGLSRWSGAMRMNSLSYWGWLARLPYIAFGLLLGASLWYVARRLYGNAGGYVALTLYCFSPAVLRAATLWGAPPDIGAAWGTFGAIFTAIAVAHTLYAPREVILWNWRRILLLGLSLALAVGCEFSLVILLPLTLVFMLYVAHTRRMAALTIWAAATILGALLLYAAYAFRTTVLWQGLHHAQFLQVKWQAFAMRDAYRQVLAQLAQGGPSLLLMLPVSLIIFLSWPRARYFGNTTPLLVALLCLILGLAEPHSGAGLFLLSIPFLFVFVAGIMADLLETPQRSVVLACIWAVLSANALANLVQLARVG